ncbi:hypothetical protein [Rheinheimera soli]|uniref:MarR family transcriptional regulator n=1 Tax=Rheinheimera soli TaxID=443616 RepID=A0ABU1VVW4_9GAMM|nr:hypothetical protein [Rheinheimera soli]MDR7119725.1 hypothetical protein [Rheinheimera soli]
MSAVQTAQICPNSVFTVGEFLELTTQQMVVLHLIDQHCIGAESVISIGAIKRSGVFHSHAQAVYQVNELADKGWLLAHEGTYRPSPKTINWLKDHRARVGLSAATQEQNHVV